MVTQGSDIDLALRSPTLEPLGNGYFDLLEALERCNIPILMQAHDWVRLPSSFHREIERTYVVIRPGARAAGLMDVQCTESPPDRRRTVALGDSCRRGGGWHSVDSKEPNNFDGEIHIARPPAILLVRS